jgi:SAM-dependent methyltransferase
MIQPEFDRYSASYEELLKDPIRDRFAGGSEFFHRRKRDLIREYFRNQGMDPRGLHYLDVGCGKGELISMLRDDFQSVSGCDPSPGMLGFVDGLDTRVQDDPAIVPFENATFDFISAVCVYHHVPPQARLAFTREVYRVLRPGGIFVLIEHNPNNPVTRLIVGRTPVDADAILLRASEARQWMLRAGFSHHLTRYFLFLPEALYQHGGRWVEGLLGKVPMGGQYANFGRKLIASPANYD